MPQIVAEDVSFSYGDGDVLSHVSLAIDHPSFVVFLGANGSGKSTFVHLLDGLLPLKRGEIAINGMSLKDRNALYDIRKEIGIVFQDPDSQFVSPLLYSDVAFGPENYNVDEKEVEKRVDESLLLTGLEAYKERLIQTLSGGEKERAQLAGVLALDPSILIFDEAFSMLDSNEERKLRSYLSSLRENRILLMITHDIRATHDADRIVLFSDGRIIADGTPSEILQDTEMLREAGIRVTLPAMIAAEIRKLGIETGPVVTKDDLEALLWS